MLLVFHIGHIQDRVSFPPSISRLLVAFASLNGATAEFPFFVLAAPATREVRGPHISSRPDFADIALPPRHNRKQHAMP